MSNEMFYIDSKTGKKSDVWIHAELLGEDPEELQIFIDRVRENGNSTIPTKAELAAGGGNG